MATDDANNALEAKVQAFFHSLNEPQRKILASLSDEPENIPKLGEKLVAKAKKSMSPASSLGGTGCVLATIKEGGGTGHAFLAFSERAVDLGYLTRQQRDTIAARIARIQDAGAREAALVAAMRRFLSTGQPLGGNMRVTSDCNRVKNIAGIFYDLNGESLDIDGFAPPGGNPERYNVCLDVGDGCRAVLQIEPKHLRPGPLDEDEWDEYHEPIPEDHKADEWWEEVLQRYEHLCAAGMASFGAPRPSGPMPY